MPTPNASSIPIPDEIESIAFRAYRRAWDAFGDFVPLDGEREYTMWRVDHGMERSAAAWTAALEAAAPKLYAAWAEGRVEAVARELSVAGGHDEMFGRGFTRMEEDYRKQARAALGLGERTP